jgi:hypothetical protein
MRAQRTELKLNRPSLLLTDEDQGFWGACEGGLPTRLEQAPRPLARSP